MPIFNHGLPIKANVIQGEGGADTSQDTVTPETLLEGVTAHNAAGEPIVGTCDYNANTENDTVTAEKLVLGETAHDASGQPVTGTLDTEAIRAEGYTDGVADGQQAGYNTGYTEGKADGIESEKEREYNAFWDAYQLSGGRNYNYDFAFAGQGWSAAYLRPKYDMRPERCQSMFAQTGIKGDVEQLIADAGVIFDTSKCTLFTNFAVYASAVTRFPTLDLSSSAETSLNLFQGCQSLIGVRKVVVTENSGFATSAFNLCKVLEDIIFEGTIGKTGLNLSWSPLSKASLISVINALSDTTTGLTVTLRLSAVKKAFETSEGANNGAESSEWQNLVMSKPNWTINAIDS